MLRITREKWKPVPGYEGYYDVSNLGHLRSYYKGRWLTDNPRPAKLHLSAQGYPIAHLSVNGVVFKATISRLVLHAFIGPAPEGKPYACHNDRNPLNNGIYNLRWGSNADNQADRIKHGTSNTGESNGMAVLTEDSVIEIKQRLLAGEKQKNIAIDFNVDHSTISFIHTGRTWRHLLV